MDNPYIQRVSFEDIQEFKNLDLFDLTLEQTNGRTVLLAYDPESQTFKYAYMEDGDISTDNQNLTVYYGFSDILKSFIDDGNAGDRPSASGFKNGDGIIANATIGTITQFDFYEVKITEDFSVDTYEFQSSIVGGAGDGAATIINNVEPVTVIEGGTWFQPVTGGLFVGNGGVWDPVVGIPGADGADGLPGTPGADGLDGAPGTPGADGNPGLVYKRSTVFTRTSTLFEGKTVIVTGGRFGDPYPTETTIDDVPTVIQWFDGIPSGTEKVWQTTFVFNDGLPDVEDPGNIWSIPAGITDTSTTDFQYSTVVSAPGTPTTIPGNWSESIGDPTAVIWIAQRSIRNGIFGEWSVWMVKGETGDQGNGLDIKGRDSACNILQKSGVADYDIWLVNATASIEDMALCSGFTMDSIASANDAFLKVPDGTGEGGSNWDNIGPVVGTDGASFLYSIVYKRSVGNPGAPTGGTFAAPVPVGWSDGIPALVLPVPAGQQLWMTSRHFSDDITSNAALADWITPSVAADSNDFEFEYAYMQAGDAEPAPPNVSPGLWSDIPGETEYYWMAKAKKINGVVDQTSWKVNRIRGEKGETGNDGESPVGKFMASAYLRTETDISAVPVTGGTYLSPVPTSTAAGKTWSDGIPATTGAIWFTHVQMLQTDTANNKVWPAPVKIIDSTSIEYRFSATGTGLPVQGNNGLNGWWDDADDVPGTPNYMAIGSITNGIWPTVWDIIKITGEQGEPGTKAYTYVPSTMFCRADTNAMATTPVTGKYLVQSNGTYIIDGPDPSVTVGGLPFTFTDGIPPLENTFPNNSKRVWMIQGVLNDNDNLGPGNEFSWGFPRILADNGSVDYQYHAGATATTPGVKPAPPTGSGNNPDSAGWYDTPDLVPNGAFWLAQKNWSEGPAAQWVVYQIRGENGTDGAGAVPLTWTVQSIFNSGGETSGVGACAIASYWDSINKYKSGDGIIGDFFANDSNGVTMFNGNNLWWTDEITAWKISTSGRILEVMSCPNFSVSTPTNVTITQSTVDPTKLNVSWSASIYDPGALQRYEIEHDFPVFSWGTTIGYTNPGVLSLLYAPGTSYGTHYFTVLADSVYGGLESPRSEPGVVQWNRSQLFYPVGYSSIAALKQAFIDSNAPDSVNVNYYVGSSTTIVGSPYFMGKTSSTPFNGGGLWYAYYTNINSNTTAYQIGTNGLVLATGALTFP